MITNETDRMRVCVRAGKRRRKIERFRMKVVDVKAKADRIGDEED